jgi:hypothetical protein
MVFMGNGRAKERKDAIPQGLRHIALVAMHRVHHELQGGIKERAGFFRIQPFDQGRRAFEISKQGSDRLPFAVTCPARFQRVLFSSDTLREVLGRVAGGRLGLGVSVLRRGGGAEAPSPAPVQTNTRWSSSIADRFA